MLDRIEAFSGELIAILVWLLLAIFAKKLLDAVIDKYFKSVYKSAQTRGRSISKKRLNTLAAAFKSIAHVMIWVGYILIVLGLLNVKLAPLLTGAGATAIIFGIAGRDIIMDLYVGFMALIEDQYRVGDDIIVNKEHLGIVEEITLRTVKLRDPEGNVHIVPHSMARSIINKTYDYSLVTVEFNTTYVANDTEIKELIDKTGKDLAHDEQWSRVFTEPIKYSATLGFDKSGMTFKALGKVKPGKQIAAESEFRLRITDALEKHGIGQPTSSDELPAEKTAVKSKKAKKK